MNTQTTVAQPLRRHLALRRPSRTEIASRRPIVLTERDEASPEDRILNLLIRRTPHPDKRGGRGGTSSEQAHAGHTRTAMHRRTMLPLAILIARLPTFSTCICATRARWII